MTDKDNVIDFAARAKELQAEAEATEEPITEAAPESGAPQEAGAPSEEDMMKAMRERMVSAKEKLDELIEEDGDFEAWTALQLISLNQEVMRIGQMVGMMTQVMMGAAQAQAQSPGIQIASDLPPNLKQ